MENDDQSNLGPRKRSAKILAEKLVKDVGVTQAPVSLHRVIEYLQSNMVLQVYRISASEKVSGLLVVCKELDDEYVTIGFNENHPWYRRRFTIAHEIGHLLFGHTCNHNEKSVNETEANIFASELLIPTKFIKRDFQTTPNLKELSKLYQVSQQALTIKLMQAKLI